ncbi:MAG: fluoride efflux transporter FluC [Planctomycetota bacterium]
MIQKLLLIALAGGLGTLARYGLGGLVQRWAGAGFPWGTAAVNMLGCFLIGAMWAMVGEHLALSGEARSVILIGFLGAFTTFSTFVGETGQLLADSEWLLAGGNILLQNTLGIIVFFLGLMAGRLA